MKKIFTLVLFCGVGFISLGQTNSKVKSIANLDELRYFLESNYTANDDSAKVNCWSGLIFVRFNLEKASKITHIKYNDGTPPFIMEALEREFSALNKKNIRITEPKNNTNKTFILPVAISNELGCEFELDLNGNASTPKPDKETIKKVLRKRAFFNQWEDSARRMTKFGGKTLSYINCILLPVASISKVMY